MSERSFFDTEVEAALEVLRSGGLILYPTDTIWGIGCDATNEEAITRIYTLKQRPDSKSIIILLAEERDVFQYVAAPDPAVFPFIETQDRPTTIVFDQAVGLPQKLVAEDGSIGIRLVRDEFCRHLVKRLRKPLVSTSANTSGQPSPASFSDISNDIKNGVDHIVKWRQDDERPTQPSQVIRWHNDGRSEILRR